MGEDQMRHSPKLGAMPPLGAVTETHMDDCLIAPHHLLWCEFKILWLPHLSQLLQFLSAHFLVILTWHLVA